MTKDESLKLALEALQNPWKAGPDGVADAIIAIKEALAQPERLAELGWQEIDCPICGGGARAFPKPEQEPVAWLKVVETPGGWGKFVEAKPNEKGAKPVYTSPPAQRTWVGLNDKDIDQGLLRTNYAFKTAEAWRDGVEWAMTQLKEKNAP